LGSLATWLFRLVRPSPPLAERFPGSAAYWEKRYADGGDSGVGSYTQFAEFKAAVVNDFVADHRVESVIEFGCGDGHQLSLARYPRYVGFDVSAAAVARCRDLFRSDPTKSFRLAGEYGGERAELVLSLDVIYHLVEDEIFEAYMSTAFAAASRYVIIYASDREDEGRDGPHVRHRKFTAWVEANAAEWTLSTHIPNRYPYRGDYRTGSFAEFFVYERA
jgi:SAM-dependent methyltransferase